MRLCLALGKTRAELLTQLPSSEIALWKAYELLFGLPSARLEAVTAIAGAAMCQSWGAKITADDLIPVFEDPLAGLSLPEKLAIWASGHNARMGVAAGK